MTGKNTDETLIKERGALLHFEKRFLGLAAAAAALSGAAEAADAKTNTSVASDALATLNEKLLDCAEFADKAHTACQNAATDATVRFTASGGDDKENVNRFLEPIRSALGI